MKNKRLVFLGESKRPEDLVNNYIVGNLEQDVVQVLIQYCGMDVFKVWILVEYDESAFC